MRTCVDRRCELASVLLATALLIGCVSGPAVVLAPDPCEPLTDEQLDELQMMATAGDYPKVDAVVSAYEQHCCEDDALAGRDVSHCEED